MLKVGIIGCGNAGNQVCALCAKKYPDIPVVAINCSEKDMQTLPNTIRKVSIGDGKGAGKNRDEAKNFLQNSIMEFLSDEDIKKFLDLLCKEDSKSNYPYSKEEYREYFRHSLWMIPGVKEAKALSKMEKNYGLSGMY